MTAMSDLSPMQKRAFSLLHRLRHADRMPLFLCITTVIFYAHFCLYLGLDPTGRSGYCTYTLQAMAWRSGQISLGRDYTWLELAVYQGDWYVSFPPVPRIPLFFLTFLYGSETPDHLLVKLYVLVGCLGLYSLLRHCQYSRIAAACFSLMCSFASCMLSLTTDGAVWYQAQTLAFCLTVLSLSLMVKKKTTLSLLLYALSVGCRPFNVLYGPVLLVLYLAECRKAKMNPRKTIAKAVPGIIAGLFVAAAYAWYNWARFGNPFEFGHNYLPEFSWQGGVQFSLSHIPANIKTFILGLPFQVDNGQLSLNTFGFSFLIASPFFILLLVHVIHDILHREICIPKLILILCMLIHLLLLLMHRTFGGYQFGARYTCDLLPYAALYPAVSEKKWGFGLPDAVIFIFSVCFSVYGAAVVLL